MRLSTSSSITIDLMLLADAAAVNDEAEVRRLAIRLEATATVKGCGVIATHARTVGRLAADGAAQVCLAHAVSRLLAESERLIHADRFHDLGRTGTAHE